MPRDSAYGGPAIATGVPPGRGSAANRCHGQGKAWNWSGSGRIILTWGGVSSLHAEAVTRTGPAHGRRPEQPTATLPGPSAGGRSLRARRPDPVRLHPSGAVDAHHAPGLRPAEALG